MNRNLVKALFLSAAILVSPAPYAGGIPVIDVASIAQTILVVKGQAKQLLQLIDQVKTAKSQLTEAKATLASLSGGRGMAALMDMSGVRQMLPPELMQAADAVRSLGSAGASKDARRIYESISKFACDQQFPTNMEMRRLCEADTYSAPTTLSLVQDSVKRSEQRAESLQKLLGQIDTKDAKAAADMTNRIQIESAMLANEKMLMDMALQNQTVQRELVAQQVKEIGRKRIAKNDGFDPLK